MTLVYSSGDMLQWVRVTTGTSKTATAVRGVKLLIWAIKFSGEGMDMVHLAERVWKGPRKPQEFTFFVDKQLRETYGTNGTPDNRQYRLPAKTALK